MRGEGVLVVVLATSGCRYDAAGLGTAATAGDETTTAAAEATTTGIASTSSGPLTGDGEATLTGPASDGGDASGSTAAGTTGPEVPMLVDEGLLARWYVDEASEGQAPLAVLDHHAPAVDLELAYAADSPTYLEVDGSRGLRWAAVERGGRAWAPILGTKLERELTAATQATFEFVVAVSEVGAMTSRFLHVGTTEMNGDLSIGCASLDELEVRWGGLIYRYAGSLDGERQVVHVVVDTPQADPMQRLRVYLDGVQLEPQGDPAPAQGEGMPLLPTSMLVLGNRTDGGRSFRGTLMYAAIYTVALDEAQIESDRALLLASDDAP